MQFKAYIYVPARQDGVVACRPPLVLATSARPGEELGLVVLAVAFEAPSRQGTLTCQTLSIFLPVKSVY